MTETSTLRAIDSLCANEFALEIDGEQVSGIFRISGLQTFKLDEQGRRVRAPFIVSKMVQRDANNAFNKWLRETVAAEGDERPKRNVAIVAIDDGVETRRWTAEGAWISEVRYSDFDSASFEMVEEIYTIHYDRIVESWPASDSLT